MFDTSSSAIDTSVNSHSKVFNTTLLHSSTSTLLVKEDTDYLSSSRVPGDILYTLDFFAPQKKESWGFRPGLCGALNTRVTAADLPKVVFI